MDWVYSWEREQAGNLLGIPVLDHVVVTEDGYHSIRESHPEIFFND